MRIGSLLTVVVAVATACTFQRGPRLDRAQWSREQIGLSRLDLVFVAPQHRSPDIPSVPRASRVDLAHDLTRDRPAPRVFGRTWDYDGHFWQGLRLSDVTLLTPAHYLQVAFDFVDNSRGYETTPRSETQSIADSIAASLEVRETQ